MKDNHCFLQKKKKKNNHWGTVALVYALSSYVGNYYFELVTFDRIFCGYMIVLHT